MEILIEEMASDLGIKKYNGESYQSWTSRVLYSAVSCWIKTSTLDSPGCEVSKGVSKKHVLLKCRPILEEFVNRYKEQSDYFLVNESGEDAVSILRSRLLAADEIRVVGFDSYIILSSDKEISLTESLNRCFGKLLDEDAFYSGVSLLRKGLNESFSKPIIQSSEEWFDDFTKRLWWEEMGHMDELEFFDPFRQVNNLYGCWGKSLVSSVNGFILARRTVNLYDYEYFIIKQGEKMKYHGLEPLGKELQLQIRLAILFKALANNPMTANIDNHDEYVRLKLYNKLPLKERQILETYAWPNDRIDNEYDWVMSSEIWDYVKPYIEALNIVLCTEGING